MTDKTVNVWGHTAYVSTNTAGNASIEIPSIIINRITYTGVMGNVSKRQGEWCVWALHARNRDLTSSAYAKLRDWLLEYAPTIQDKPSEDLGEVFQALASNTADLKTQHARLTAYLAIADAVGHMLGMLEDAPCAIAVKLFKDVKWTSGIRGIEADSYNLPRIYDDSLNAVPAIKLWCKRFGVSFPTDLEPAYSFCTEQMARITAMGLLPKDVYNDGCWSVQVLGGFARHINWHRYNRE